MNGVSTSAMNMYIQEEILVLFLPTIALAGGKKARKVFIS